VGRFYKKLVGVEKNLLVTVVMLVITQTNICSIVFVFVFVFFSNFLPEARSFVLAGAFMREEIVTLEKAIVDGSVDDAHERDDVNKKYFGIASRSERLLGCDWKS